MILAAAERQALRQATPLSGLVAQGELDRAEESEAVVPLDEDGPLHDDEQIADDAEHVLHRAEALGHAGLSNRGAAAMALRGQSVEAAREWLDRATATLSGMADGPFVDAQAKDAQVVEDPDDGDPVPPPEAEPGLAMLRKMAADHRDEAKAVMAEEPLADNAQAEADQINDEAARPEARADALEQDEQASLEGVE